MALAAGASSAFGQSVTATGDVSPAAVSSPNWNVGDKLYVGLNGTGTLTISGGGTVSNTSGFIGFGGDGAVIVTGPGSTWTNSSELQLGSFGSGSEPGSGTLIISDGGTVSSASASIGLVPGRTSTVTVTGPGSSWTINGGINVGEGADGRLTIEDGGRVIINGNPLIWGGTVTVRGQGSTLTSAGLLSVGAGVELGTLRIESGGTVTSDRLTINASNSSIGSTVTVTGANALLDVAGIFRLGITGPGLGILTIADGGEVRVGGGAGTVTLGFAGTGAVGVMNIGAAAGDAAQAAGTLSAAAITVGGGTGTLVFNHTETAYHFAPVILGAIDVKHLAGVTTLTSASPNFTGTVNVSGGTLNIDNVFGNTTSYDTIFNVTNTGTLSGNGEIAGVVSLNDGGTLRVGAGQSLAINGLRVGDSSGSGTFIVENGGTVASVNAQTVASIFYYLGYQAGTSGAVIVRGAGSVWTIPSLYVGFGGTGSVTVEDGGKINGGTVTIGSDPTGSSVSSVTVTGQDSQWTATNVYAGDYSGGELTISNGGNVTVNNGSGTLNIAYDAGATGTVNIGAAAGQAATAAGTLSAARIAFGAGPGGNVGIGTLVFNHTGNPDGSNYVFSTLITGRTAAQGVNSGTVRQIAGTTILTGVNGTGAQFSGTTSVEGGTLLVNGTFGNTATNAATVNVTGGTLGGSGTIAGSVSVASGGTLAGVQGQTLTIGGNLALGSGAAVNVTLGAAGNTTGLFKVNGALTLDGTLNVSDAGGFGAGIYRIVDYVGALTDNGLTVGTLASGDSGTVQTAIANQVNLVVTAASSSTEFWNGTTTTADGTIHGGAGTWTAGPTTNWTDANGANAAGWDGGFAVFQANPATVTVDASAGAVSATGLQFIGDGWRVEGAPVTLGGAGGTTTIRVGDGTQAGAAWSATIASELTGASALVKDDYGTLILTGNNAYSGGTTISGGTLQLGNSGTSGSILGNVLNDGVLAFNRSDIITFAGDISGSGAVQQIGAGTTILTGANSYSGDTLVAGGRLQFGDGSVGGSNNLGGNVAVTGGTLAIQSPTTLNVAQNVSFADNTALSIVAGATGPALSATSVTIGSGVAFNISGISNAGELDKVLIDTTAGISGDFATVTVGGFTGIVDYLTLSTRKSADNLQYLASYGLSWNAGNNLANGTFTLTDAADGFTVGTVLADQAANPATGWNGTALTKAGAGTLILTSDNTYSGGTTISGGTLQLGDGGTSGLIHGNVVNDGVLAFNRSDIITFAGDISGSGAVQQIGAGTTILTGANSYSGDTLVAGGRLQFGDGSAGGSNNLGGNLTVAGGTLAIQTPATLNVAQNVSFADNTALSIVAGASSPALSANSVTIGNGVAFNISGISNASELDTVLIDTTAGISGDFATVTVGGFNGTVDYLTMSSRKSADSLQYLASYGLSWNAGNNLANGTFTLTNATDSFTVGAVLADRAANPATGWNGTSLTKAGAGTLILTGENTYSGGTTISGGTLQLGNGGTSGSILGNVANSGVLAFNRSDVVTFAGAIAGSGAVQQIGSGTTILTGSSSYTGGTTISGGMLQIGNAGTTGSIAGNVVNDGVLAFNRSDVVTFAGDISGSGQVRQIGPGATILTGENTYSGGTTISAGTLQIGNGGTTGSILGNVVNESVLAFDRSDTMTFAGDISGSGAVRQTGAGTTILTGASTYTGGTTISDGTLQIGNGGATGSIAGNVTNNGTLAFDRADAFSFAGVISGTGAVNQVGSGTTTLTGANSSVGAVTVSNGTLAFSQTGLFSATHYETQNGAVTTIGASAQIVVSGAFTQDTGSTLSVTLGSNDPIITAGSASLSGTLNIAGLTLGTAPSSASALAGTQFTVITTTNGISGDFANVTIGGSSSPVDYLTATGGKSADNLTYNVGLDLTWTAGAARGNGTFTLTSSTDAFNVDLALTNQSGPFAGGWDGSSLTKAGDGTLTLSAMNTYTGTTTINGGTLAITATGGITSDVTNNATLQNAGTVTGSVTNNAGALFSQTGGSVSNGVINHGTVTASGGALNGAIANNVGGVFTVGGTLTSDSTFANASGATLTVSAVGNYSLAGLLTNDGAVTIAAGGALTAPAGILNSAAGVISNNGTVTDALNNAGLVINNGTYNASVASNSGTINNTAGAIWNGNFNNAGTVNTDGTINGSLTQTAGTTTNNGTITGVVAVSGGQFSGTGSTGGLIVNSGATFAPGVDGGIGTVSVAGSVTFNAGSTYQVAVNAAGQGSRINATASIAINGGAVNVLAGAGNYAPATTYTILSTTTIGGRTGTFESVSSNLAFLTPALGYDASNVYLTLTRNNINFAAAGITAQQTATGGSVESLGFGNPVYDAVLNLSTPQAQAAFDQLSGEIHASAKTALIEDSRFVRSAVNDRIRAAFDAVDASGKVTTYVDGKPVTVPANTDRFAVWGQGFGSWGHTNGDGNAARLTRSTSGFFIGADAPIFDSWRFGAVAGYSRTAFDVKDRRSSGASDNYHVGLYGGTAWADLAFRTGAAYTWHDLSTSRGVIIPGFGESLKGKYNAATAQVFGELAYGFSARGARFEPFANLAYVSLSTRGFTEQGGAAALTGASSSTDAAFTTLGLRASATFDLGGSALTASGMVGWRHAFDDVTPVSTMHFAGGGDAFSIGGVPVTRDAAVIEAGLDYAITPNASLGATYGGQFGSGVTDQSARLNFNVKF